VPHIRRWAGARRVGRGRVGELTMPVDTADQALCTLGQTDNHSSPDHTTRKTDIKWNSSGP